MGRISETWHFHRNHLHFLGFNRGTVGWLTESLPAKRRAGVSNGIAYIQATLS